MPARSKPNPRKQPVTIKISAALKKELSNEAAALGVPFSFHAATVLERVPARVRVKFTRQQIAANQTAK